MIWVSTRSCLLKYKTATTIDVSLSVGSVNTAAGDEALIHQDDPFIFELGPFSQFYGSVCGRKHHISSEAWIEPIQDLLKSQQIKSQQGDTNSFVEKLYKCDHDSIQIRSTTDLPWSARHFTVEILGTFTQQLANDCWDIIWSWINKMSFHLLRMIVLILRQDFISNNYVICS